MDDLNIPTSDLSVGQEATRALLVSAASVAGTFIGIGAVLAAVGVTSTIKDKIAAKKAKKNND